MIYPVHVHQVGVVGKADGCLALAGVTVQLGFDDLAPGALALFVQVTVVEVDGVGFLLGQAGLGNEVQQVCVAAVGIGKDDLFEPVAPDLIQHAEEKFQQQGGLEGHGAGEAARFVDLAEVEGWKDHGGFNLGGQAGNLVPVEEIGAQGQVLGMPLQHAQGEHAHAGIFDGPGKVG